MKEVLITGGAGFIGFHVAKELSKSKEYRIVLFDNFFRSKADTDLKKLMGKNQNVRLVKGDLINSVDLKKLGNDFDYIYHFGAINGTRNFYDIPDRVLKTNIVSSINVLEWFLHSKKNAKAVFSSSSETYAGTAALYPDFPIPTPEDVPLTIDNVFNPRWSYAASKIIGELLFIHYSKVHHKRMSIVRFHNVYGPRMGYDHVVPEFLRRIKNKENPFKIFGGTETRAFGYIDDMVTAVKKVMETKKTDNEIVNIGNGTEEITIKALAERIFRVTNFNPVIDMQPAPAGSTLRRCPDVSKLRKLTGFVPVISLEEGLKKTWDWYKKL